MIYVDGWGDVDLADTGCAGPADASEYGVDSPRADIGSATAILKGLNNRTSRTDDNPDRAMLNLGYHYPMPPALPPSPRSRAHAICRGKVTDGLGF